MSAGSIELDRFAQRPPVEVVPIRDHGIEFDAFNPRIIDRDTFSRLPGEVQQVALKYLTREGDVDSLSRLRPDFEMERPFDRYEIAIADAIHSRTAKTEQITGDLRDPEFNFIHSFVSNTEPELARKLEDERKRREENPGRFFYSHENIGRFSAARRYRRALELEVITDIAREKQLLLDQDEARRRSELAQASSVGVMLAEVRAKLTVVDERAA